LEFAVNYRVNHDWRLQTSYTANQFQVEYDKNNSRWLRDPLVEPHANPQQSLSFRSLYNLTDDIEFDGWIRYVDQLLIQDTRIPAYVALDLRLGWHPQKNLELSLVGQNLLDNQHPEFQDLLFVPVASQIQRGYLATINWRF
jgi:iron complex outermembrane receptor protein